jgi:hypothetical protein
MRFISLCLCLTALALAGCAKTTVTGMQAAVAGNVPKPKAVVVTDLAFSSEVVALDRGFTARLARKLGDLSPDERKQRTAERVNDEIVATIVATLREAGLEVRPGSEETLTLNDDVLVVSGRLRAVDEGNVTKRRLIGFGAGHSGVVAEMTVAQFSSAGKKQLLAFTAESESGKKPGAIIAAPISAATGAAIAAATAAGGVVAEKLSADVQAQARSLGRVAAGKIVAYARAQGWLAAAEVPGKPQT